MVMPRMAQGSLTIASPTRRDAPFNAGSRCSMMDRASTERRRPLGVLDMLDPPGAGRRDRQTRPMKETLSNHTMQNHCVKPVNVKRLSYMDGVESRELRVERTTCFLLSTRYATLPSG